MEPRLLVAIPALALVLAACSGDSPGPEVVPVATVTVSPATSTLEVGGTQQLTATLEDADGGVLTGRTVTWTTSHADIATVEAGTGLVRAEGAGNATITATSEGVESTASVTVVEEPLKLYGIDESNRLVSFSPMTPGTVVTRPLSGLYPADQIVDLDYRPANGVLYALTNQARLYAIAIHPTTAVATPVAAAAFATLQGGWFGMDINPTVDRVRVVTGEEQNLRVDPATGNLSATDTTLSYAAADLHSGANPLVFSIAYTNSFVGATTTTVYGIDTELDTLVLMNPPNAGILNTVGALGVNFEGPVGFDIDGTTGIAYATSTGTDTKLYTINLTSGVAALVGTIGGGERVRGITVKP